jgi:hypothetical protein
MLRLIEPFVLDTTMVQLEELGRKFEQELLLDGLNERKIGWRKT